MSQLCSRLLPTDKQSTSLLNSFLIPPPKSKVTCPNREESTDQDIKSLCLQAQKWTERKATFSGVLSYNGWIVFPANL